MPLFLRKGCFPVDFQEVKRPLRTKSVKCPIKVGKRKINEGKRPIKAKVLVGISVGCLMGCCRATPPWRKTAPLKRPIKRSMRKQARFTFRTFVPVCPREKFMNSPFSGLVCRGDSWHHFPVKNSGQSLKQCWGVWGRAQNWQFLVSTYYCGQKT